MPTLTDTVNTVLPAGMSLAQWLASRNSLNNATQTVQQGATTAGRQLDMASAGAITGQNAALGEQRHMATDATRRTDAATQTALDAQKAALEDQRHVYGTTLDANQPYSEFGKQSIQQLQDLQAHPETLRGTPGYQFGLDEALKAQERTAAARGTVGNGGQVRAQTRNALDYASTKYQEAWNRLMQATGVGERANAANASAGVTLGNQEQANANNVGGIVTSGARENNATMADLSSTIGQTATRTGNLGVQNAEDQASLTLASAELAAKNQGLQGNNTISTLETLGKAAPTILKAAGIGGAATGAAAGGSLGAVAAGAVPSIPLAGIGGGVAAAPATGLTGALGLGGGSGIAGLGAATIPVVGGIIAGGILLANHFIGQGRKAADKLTGDGGIQHAFEDTLKQIASQPGYSEAQKWESSVQAYQKLKELGMQVAQKGKNEFKTASQMFDTISPLFGEPNPLKAVA